MMQMLKSTWKNSIKNLLLSPLIKYQNNFAYIFRKYKISKLVTEFSPNKNKNSTSTYSQTQKSEEKIIQSNIKYWKKFYLKKIDQDETLPIMYLSPKMHETPIEAGFLVASKSYSNKPLSNVISKVFKMIFNHVETFHKKY